jgi:hypothetical protein
VDIPADIMPIALCTETLSTIEIRNTMEEHNLYESVGLNPHQSKAL